MSASPEKLISLLLAGARASIAKAKLHFEHNNVPERGMAIGKAVDIVTTGLRAAVLDSMGEVAKSLVMTYDLVAHHLTLANLRAQVEHLDIADAMLADIQSAWNEATNQFAHPA
jgi:flagellar protein FliS